MTIFLTSVESANSGKPRRLAVYRPAGARAIFRAPPSEDRVQLISRIRFQKPNATC